MSKTCCNRLRLPVYSCQLCVDINVECSIICIMAIQYLYIYIYVFIFRFCCKHRNTIDPASISNFKQPPADLLMVTEKVMPRILLRLVQYLRENRYF